MALFSLGIWRHTHWGALFSAYGRTPFFDYFADDLKQIYTDESIQTIASLNLTLHAAVIDFLDLDIETVVVDNKNDLAASDALNLRDGVLTEQTLEQTKQTKKNNKNWISAQSEHSRFAFQRRPRGCLCTEKRLETKYADIMKIKGKNGNLKRVSP